MPATKKVMNARLVQEAISSLVGKYQAHTPTARTVVSALEGPLGFSNIHMDHLAFRTFGTKKLGIDSLGDILLNLGFVQGNHFEFTQKKLRATWFAPPKDLYEHLPRIFISELKLHEMSTKTQQIVESYVHEEDKHMTPATMLSSLLTGFRPWRVPEFKDYEALAEESEYAAWVLAYGYALNHFALTTHRMISNAGPTTKVQQGFQNQGDSNYTAPPHARSNDVETVTRLLIENGFPMNQEGALVKVSPDGQLLQTSTIADSRNYVFADGVSRSIPGSYVEFVQRKLKPEFASLRPDEIREYHRRDGFETASADKIFESTNVNAKRVAKL